LLLGKKRDQVSGYVDTVINVRPNLNRWIGDELTAEVNNAQVVVQVSSFSAMLCIAGLADSGRALSPMANATDVLASRVGKEDVGASVLGLYSTLQPSGFGCKCRKVKIVRDGDKEIGIFRIGLVGRQRPDQSNPFDTRD